MEYTPPTVSDIGTLHEVTLVDKNDFPHSDGVTYHLHPISG